MPHTKNIPTTPHTGKTTCMKTFNHTLSLAFTSTPASINRCRQPSCPPAAALCAGVRSSCMCVQWKAAPTQWVNWHATHRKYTPTTPHTGKTQCNTSLKSYHISRVHISACNNQQTKTVIVPLQSSHVYWRPTNLHVCAMDDSAHSVSALASKFMCSLNAPRFEHSSSVPSLPS